jgi:omega-3 fatty acid desaturase (delta-15 desaturase)
MEELPEELPSIIEIKNALPKHCFKSSVPLSMYYAVKDCVQVVLVYLVLCYLSSLFTSPWIHSLLIVLYWAVQGTFFMALFVLGHDCGHSSFSDYPLLNDIVGTITHAFLMVPFYQWKLSHRHHHKNTANVDKDEVFYPVRRSDRFANGSSGKMLPGFAFGLGWYIYLAVGYRPRNVNHFNPWEAMFLGHLVGCICSLLMMGVYVYLAFLYFCAYGLAALTLHYLVPLLLFGSYIVIITFLHHTEVNIPWYADSRWDFVRGQLSTIDRHYGIIHHVIHCIGTHQMHHMFTKIPHYHLEEATVHFRKAFPHLVRTCEEPILPSFVRMFNKFDRQSCTMPDDARQHTYK